MPPLVFGNNIYGAKVGVQAPANADVDIINNNFHGVEVAVNFKEPITLEMLGIPIGAPSDQVSELVREFRKTPDASVEQATAIVNASRLGQWLGNAEKVAKVANSLVALVKAGQDLF